MKVLNLIVISAALLVSFANANASLGTPKYHLKGAAVTGSRILPIEATSTVPFTKSYQDLSTKQQDMIRSRFNNLGINDVPPYPSRGLKSVYKPVIEAHKKFSNSKSLKVLIDVASNGSVDKVSVENSNNLKLNRYVARALTRVDFTPASCNGVACEMQFPVEISFN